MKEERCINVMIADDHDMVRRGLRALIEQEPDLQVVAEASNGKEAVEAFLRHRPEVSVVDLHMPVADGVAAITSILKEAPQAHIVCLTSFGGDEDVYRALRAGANGYVMKEAPPEQLFACIRAVAQGQTWIAPQAAGKLAQRLSMPELTPRELEILRLLAAAKSNKEIASKLNITQGTAKVHVNNILRKLHAGNRMEAALIAHQRGLIDSF